MNGQLKTAVSILILVLLEPVNNALSRFSSLFLLSVYWDCVSAGVVDDFTCASGSNYRIHRVQSCNVCYHCSRRLPAEYGCMRKRSRDDLKRVYLRVGDCHASGATNKFAEANNGYCDRIVESATMCENLKPTDSLRLT